MSSLARFISTARTWLDRIQARFASPDPRASIAGSISLLVLSNQPFYPLYLYFVLGHRAWPSLLTWLSAPFFAAVPWAGRGHPNGAGRMLLGAGIGNTALSALALGVASRVELFYLPCGLLAVVLFEGRARRNALLASGIAMVALAILVRIVLPDGLATLTAEDIVSVGRINMFSVAGLTAMIGYMSRRLFI